MADGTGIQWSNATWNIVTGCSVYSEGCKNCYAMKLAGGRLRNHPSREGLTTPTKNGPVWNGKVRFNEDWLDQPLRWKKPRKIFVCAHGDLFHESVPDDWIDRVFAVMALAPQHSFQVLTKRSERMRQYFSPAMATFSSTPAQRIQGYALDYLKNGCFRPNGYGPHFPGEIQLYRRNLQPLPLANVWLGVSVENQATADERIGDLMRTRASIRWVSYEPAVHPVDFSKWVRPITVTNCHGTGDHPELRLLLYAAARDVRHERHPDNPGLDWIVTGGESGPRARPTHPDDYRQVRDLCAAGMIPYFHKQWGRWLVGKETAANRYGLPLVYGDGATFDVASDGADIMLSSAQDHRGKPKHLWREYWASGDGRLLRQAVKTDELPFLDGVQHGAFPA